jgi:hypothetical protein
MQEQSAIGEAAAPGGGARRILTGLRRVLLLAVLYSMPVVWALHGSASLVDPDIWWHLSAGDWILSHHAFPHADPFSATCAGKPWQAYSWLFEIPMSLAYRYLGLAGICAASSLIVALFAIALHRLLFRIVPDLVVSLALAFAALMAVGPLNSPRPWLITFLFFTLELQVLVAVRRGGPARRLLWLPLLFAVWANVHIQFMNGLLILGLLAADSWWRWLRARGEETRRSRNLWTALLAGCALSVAANPYFFLIYKVAFDLTTQRNIINMISELAAPHFRSPADYVLLAIAMGAVAAMAWQRQRKLLPWCLLAVSTVVAFRSARDVWMLAILGTVLVAVHLPARAWRSWTPSGPQWAGVLVLMLGIVAGAVHFFGVTTDSMTRKLEENFPAAAVRAVHNAHVPGPIFNTYSWGGYLIWSLPELPVSLDGRSALHGTDRIERSIATWNASHDWATDPELQRARVVLAPLDVPLSGLLRLDGRYKLFYEDKVAAVFTRAQ